MRNLFGRLRTSGGSVLMEYVVVNLAVAVPLVCFWQLEIFNPSQNEWVGTVGKGIQSMFQRVSSGIALPIP